jgi:hypothetical protein
MTEETNKQEIPQQDPTQLTLTDLAAMKSIIDIASARGTFKPNEMMIVGQTYNKLTTFLEGVSFDLVDKFVP